MIRYYPKGKIKMGLISDGSKLLLDGKPYIGKYYQDFRGRCFSGVNPIIGDNRELLKVSVNSPVLKNSPATRVLSSSTALKQSVFSKNNVGKPTSYFPNPTEDDYKRGLLNRYFVKKKSDNGYVIEISPEEYQSIKSGFAPYDISEYITADLVWKLTGPLETQRLSQWDIRIGIIEYNKTRVETLNKTFLGIKDFIGGDYQKYSRPTK